VVNDEIQVLNTIRAVIKTHNPSIVYAGYMSPSQIVLFSVRDEIDSDYFKARISRIDKASIDDYVSFKREKIREFGIP